MNEKEVAVQERNLKGWIKLFLTGLCMGSADIVPGVSGGTMAFIMGIYSELIDNTARAGSAAFKLLPRFKIKEFFSEIKLPFFLVLGAGIFAAIISLSSLISYLLDSHPAYVFSFFGGLILASAIAVCSVGKFTKSAWIAMIICTVLTAIVVGLNPMENVSHSLPVLFLSGMIAISAMVLPGISGSFILLILGQYEFILEAVHNRDLLPVITVAAGCGIGILLAVHVVNFFLTRFHNVTIAALVGIMIGSLRLIFDKVSSGLAIESAGAFPSPLFALVLCVLGFVFVTALDHMQSKKNPICCLWKKSKRVDCSEAA